MWKIYIKKQKAKFRNRLEKMKKYLILKMQSNSVISEDVRGKNKINRKVTIGNIYKDEI